MESKQKILIGCIIGLILVIGLIYCLLPENNINLEKIPIKIGYKDTSHYLSVFVAKEKGYFAEEGLDAELIKFESSNQVMDMVLAGKLDASRGGLILQLEVEEENPGTLKTFLLNKQTLDNYIDFVLVRKDSPFQSLKEFKGTIGTPVGADKIHLSVALKKLGIFDNVKILELKPDLLIAALESKQVDAIFAYEPTINVALEKGTARIMESKIMEKYVISPWIGGGIFMTSDTIKNNPEKAKKIYRAFYKAGNFIAEYPEEAKLILKKYTPLDENIIKQLHALPEYSPFEHPELITYAQGYADIFYQEGYLTKNVDVSKMLVDLR